MVREVIYYGFMALKLRELHTSDSTMNGKKKKKKQKKEEFDASIFV